MKRALLSPRAWLLSLLALALILGPLAPFLAPPPASASHGVTVWSATLTVKTLLTSVGCSSNATNAAQKCSTAATLTEDEFTYLGNNYRIVQFDHPGIPGKGYTIGLDKGLSAVQNDFKELILHVDNVPVSLIDAQFTSNLINPSLSSFGSVPVPSAGDTVELKLTLPGPGDLDETFGIGGKLTTAFNATASEIHDIVEQPDGKIVAVGYAHNGTNNDFALARYNPDGSLDDSFGTGGRVLTNFTVPGSHDGLDDAARAVALQSDGKIVVAGYAAHPHNAYEFVVARYNKNGTLDTSFGTEYNGSKRGFAIWNATSLNDSAQDVVIQTVGSSEHILVVGQAGESFGLVRYTNNGTLDGGFGNILTATTRSGFTTIDLDGRGEGANGVAIDGDNKIVVAGFATNQNGTSTDTSDDHKDFALIRLTTAGDRDSTFGSNGLVTTDIGSRAGGTGETANTNDRANAITLQSNGKLVVAGYIHDGTQEDFAVARYNTDGQLDGEFGRTTTGSNRSGKELANANNEEKAYAVAVDSSGKIILAGYTETNNPSVNDEFMVTRLNANGASHDNTFGSVLAGSIRSGQKLSDFALGDDRAHAMALLSSGGILLAGYSTSGSTKEFALARYTDVGEPDTDYGIGGRVTTSFSAPHAFGNAVAVQPDDKIVVAGYVENDNGTTATTDDHDDFAVTRYNPDGSLDTSFGTRGRVTTDIGTGSKDRVLAVVIDYNEKIVVAGYTSSDGSDDNRDFAVVRYTDAGELDTTLSGDGKLTTNFNSKSDRAFAVTIDEFDNIVVVGEATDSSDVGHFALARYTNAGAPDNTLDTDGKLTTAIGSGFSSANAVAIDSSDNIVTAGYAVSGTDLVFALARYTSAGALDTAFSTDGKVTTAIGSGSSLANAVAIDSSGNIVAAGYAGSGSNNDFALARYTSAGALDTSFGTGGKVTTAIGSGDDQANAMAVDSKGRIVLAGHAATGSGKEFALARYRGDGSLDTGFGSAGTGKVTTDCFVGASAQGNAIALDYSGRIMLAGTSNNGRFEEFALARYAGGSKSSDARLSALAVSTSTDNSDFSGTATLSPAFTSGTTAYETERLAKEVSHLKVTPTVSEGSARVTVNGTAVTSGTASAAIPVTVSTVNVVVTAEDRTTTQTYVITLIGPSRDATLSALTVSTSTDNSDFSGTTTLTPAFTSATTEYETALLSQDVTHVKVTPTTTDSNATITVNGTAVTSASASAAISVDDSPVSVVVTAQDGTTTQTYAITLKIPSRDATLSALTISTSTDGSTFSGAALSPAFSPGTTEYTLSVTPDITHVKVTPTVNQTNATVTVDGATLASGTASAAIAVTVGSTTTVTVVVTAQDTDVTETYTVRVNVGQVATIAVSPNPVVEGASAQITVTITQAQTGAISIPLAVSAVSAESSDYSAPSSISIAAGQTSGTGTLQTQHDPDAQDETLTVALGSTLPADLNAGAPSSVTITIDDDEVVSTVTVQGASPNPVEEGETVSVRLGISPAQPNRLVIPVTVTHGTSESGDFSTLSSIAIEANQTIGIGQIRTNHDSDAADETFTVALGTNLPLLTTAGSPNSVTVTIDDDEFASQVWIKRTYDTKEGETAYVTLGINPPQANRVVIPLTFTHGISEAGDFTALSSITIEANQTEAAGDIRTHHDPDAESETFTVALGSNLPPLIVAGTPSSAEILIEDDEFFSEVSVKRLHPETVAEGEIAYVTLGISPPQPKSVTIPITLTPVGTTVAGDFSGPTSITIAAGQTEGAGQIRANQDSDAADETLTVEMGSSLPPLILAGTPGSRTLIIDDDEAGSEVWIKRYPTNPIAEGETAYIVLGISPAQPNSVSIPITLTHGTSEAGDFSSLSSITIAANQPEAVGQIRTNQDSDAADETFTVALGSSLPPLITAGAPSTVTLEIDDDEAVSTVSIKSAYPNPVQEGETAYVTLGISPPKPNRLVIPITLTHNTSEAGDFSSLSSITIAANQSEGSGQIRINQDSDEQDETFTVALSSSLPALVVAGTPSSATITIEEPEPEADEVPSTVWIKRTSPNPVTEGETTYVVLGINPPQATRLVIPVTLTRGSAEAGDFSSLSSITIDANQTEAAGQIRTNRDSDEDDETFTVALGSSLPAQTTAGSPNSATITIAEPTPEAPSTVSIRRISPNPVAEGATVSVTLDISPAQPNRLVIPVTITHGTSETNDISALTSITIEANQLQGVGQIRTNHDSDAEDETFTVALGSNLPAKTTAGSPNSVTVTIDDDEFTSQVWIKRTNPNPVSEGATAYITLGINPPQPNRVVIPVTLTHVDSEAGDFSALTSITINANQSEGVGQIRANQDSDQNDEEFTVALGSLPVLITAGPPSSATITIDDDDDDAAATVPGERPWPYPLRRGDASLKVTWFIKDEASPYTGFDVEYREKGTTSWTSVTSSAQLDDGEGSHTITGLTNGTTYEVRVRARNSAGAGPWSTRSREAAPAAPPAAPTGLSSSTEYASSLTVSWTAPSTDVTSYNLRYRESGASDWLRYSTQSSWRDIYGASVVLAGLTSETTYEVQVRALIDDSVGAWSATHQGTPR